MTSSEYAKPLPRVTEDNRPFWEALKRHELIFQQCSSCGKFRNPSSIICPHCHSLEHSWQKVSGKGKVFTFTVFHQVYHPGFAKEVPYNVAIVELDEGVRLMSNVIGVSNDEIRCEMPVQVVFEDITPEFTLPKFRPL